MNNQIYIGINNIIKIIKEDNLHDIALVGGGGKTTTLYYIANQLKKENKILLGTSTKMQLPISNFVLSNNIIDYINFLKNNNFLFIGTISNKKLSSISNSIWSKVRKYTNYSIYEADGARMFPLKVPRKTEPIFSYDFDSIFIIVGLSSINKKIKNITNSINEICYILSKDEEHTLTIKDISSIIINGYLNLYKNIYSNKKIYILLNQADNINIIKNAKIIANDILVYNKEHNLNYKVLITSYNEEMRCIRN